MGAARPETGQRIPQRADGASARLVSDNGGPSSRRTGDRRDAPRVAQTLASIDPGIARQTISESDVQFLIPTNWSRIAPLLLVAAAVAFIGAWQLPTTIPQLFALVGCFAAVIGNRAAAIERDNGPNAPARGWLAVVTIVLPMFACGLLIGTLTIDEGLSPYLGLALVVILNGVAGTLLRSRTVSLLAAQLAIWTGVVTPSGSPLAWTALILTAAALALVARHQHDHDKRARKERMARARVQKRAEDILRDYEETGQGWFWETDRRGQITYMSPSVAKALGRSQKELVGSPFTSIFDLSENSRKGERTLAFHLSSRSSFTELAMRAAAVEEERWWSLNGRPVYDSFENFCGFRGSGTDLTEKKRSQENASRLAHYDSLTGLANRFMMSQSLEKILQTPLERERECAVFLLDLDRFKHVNDTLGHPAGDALLKQVAQRLERVVGEMGRVGRLGGDEFEVIFPGRVSKEKLGAIAHEIIHQVSQPYSLDGKRASIGTSVGIAISPQDGQSSEAIIRNADLALYAAKDGGRGCYHFYADDLHSAAEERSRLEQDLRDAISGGDLELYYQPVIEAATEQIVAFEALLRWQHPTQGWLSPAKFIPIAEDTGLIAAIGEWALRQACSDLAKWPASIRCAVNVSPLQFANPNLPSIITNAIAHAGIDPSRLELEITESVFLTDDDNTEQMFAALKRVGVRLALDDFGTGYSSLGYLKKAPFDKIKIDQSFVRGATEKGSRNGAIIASITSLAQSLGMDTTAEGVETFDELELVRELGCSHIQGFIYEKALSSRAATERLASGLTAVASGPRAARAPRATVLRKVVLEHGAHRYNGTIRNVAEGGAMVEGLWNVPPGTLFRIELSPGVIVEATSRWCEENRMGVQFAIPLRRDANGTLEGFEPKTLTVAKAA